MISPAACQVALQFLNPLSINGIRIPAAFPGSYVGTGFVNLQYSHCQGRMHPHQGPLEPGEIIIGEIGDPGFPPGVLINCRIDAHLKVGFSTIDNLAFNKSKQSPPPRGCLLHSSLGQ